MRIMRMRMRIMILTINDDDEDEDHVNGNGGNDGNNGDLLGGGLLRMDGQGPTGGIGLQAEVIMFNSVFLFTYISCLVGSVSATSGKTVKLPLIGDASDSQTR